MKTLAQFVQKKRDDLGLSPKGLAARCNLDQNLIEEIEAGKELFLSVTVRQNLAKGLKWAPEEIKKLEIDFDNTFVSEQIIESLKELILKGAGGLKCPKCGATDISLNPRSGKLRCNFCRYEFEPENKE